MKKQIIFMLCSLLSVVSCSDIEEQNPSVGSCNVTFHIQTLNNAGQSPMFAQTRSLNPPTCLLVLDVMDGKVVEKNIIERNTDSVLTTLDLNLDFGDHELYFVAARNAYDSYDKDNLTMKWGQGKKLNLVWANKHELTVARENIEVQQIDMNLVVSQLVLAIKDELPANLKSITTSGTGLSWTLDLKTMQGISGEVANTIEIPENYSGASDFSTYTFVPEGGEVGNVTFAAYSNDEEPIVLAQHTVEDVSVQIGWKTKYTGWFFANEGGFSFTLEENWKGESTIDF